MPFPTQVVSKIRLVDDRLVVSSVDLAELLGRNHFYVLNKIKQLCSAAAVDSSDFQLVNSLNGKALLRPAFLLSCAGFLAFAVAFMAPGFGAGAEVFWPDLYAQTGDLKASYVAALVAARLANDVNGDL